MARRWGKANRDRFEFPSIEAAHGEIVVGRAAEDMLLATHVARARKSARSGAIDSMRRHRRPMHRIEGVFADRFQAMKGFAAWRVFDCGGQEILWISFVRDRAAAEECDERTFRFASGELRDFKLERKGGHSRERSSSAEPERNCSSPHV